MTWRKGGSAGGSPPRAAAITTKARPVFQQLGRQRSTSTQKRLDEKGPGRTSEAIAASAGITAVDQAPTWKKGESPRKRSSPPTPRSRPRSVPIAACEACDSRTPRGRAEEPEV